MKPLTANLLLAVVALLFLASMSLFVVDQRQSAVVFELGKIVRVDKQPGIKWKLPLVQSVHYFDNRIQTVDATQPERFLTSEKKNLMVDAFVKWRIADPRLYYNSVGGSETKAQVRLMKRVNEVMRDEIGKNTIHDVVSAKRDEIMDELRDQTNADAKKIGVKVVDVRLETVDFPPNISKSVYKRMEAERKTVANALRASGQAEREKISAEADKNVQIILADAKRDAQRIMGEGDAKANEIYGKAFSRNPRFFAFYRSLQAYKKSFRNKRDVLVLDPNSAFFKYLKNGAGK